MTDPKPCDYYHDQVLMKFESGKTIWRCLVCEEDVTHQHKPQKPSYEALVTELRRLETQIAKQFVNGSSLTREQWLDLRGLIQRVDQGRE